MLTITSYCRIRENKVSVNGRLLYNQENIFNFAQFVKSVYKQEQINYPKFYKMDAVSKLGFLAAELVLREKSIEGYQPGAVGVVLSNSSSSLDTDTAHNETIRDRSNYFPSPSVFVYTLPNIVIGEICIKNRIKGENAFLISETFDSRLICGYVKELFENGRIDACLCGWAEVLDNRCSGMILLVERTDDPLPEADARGTTPIIFDHVNVDLLMESN
jgi:hypothetical protein